MREKQVIIQKNSAIDGCRLVKMPKPFEKLSESIEYDVKTLLQTVLDSMKSMPHADNMVYSKLGELRRMREFQAKKNKRRSERG